MLALLFLFLLLSDPKTIYNCVCYVCPKLGIHSNDPCCWECVLPNMFCASDFILVFAFDLKLFPRV